MKTPTLIVVFSLLITSCRDNAYFSKILVNQVGYAPNAEKIAFVLTEKQSPFYVVDVSTKQVVFTGELANFRTDDLSQEKIIEANFSALKTPGQYFLKVEGRIDSPPFVIQDNVYLPLLKSLLRNLYLHRASEDLPEQYAGKWARKKLAVEHCLVWSNPKTEKQCPGGWFDAGDYGRYATPTAVAVGLLLQAYQYFSPIFTDDLNIPESNNHISDILDEARVGLEFLLHSQDECGGIHHKATTKDFSPFGIAPWDQKYYQANPMYFYDLSIIATFNFAAVTALASRVFRSIDPKYSNHLLLASQKAWRWAQKNKKIPVFANPPEVKTGEYLDQKPAEEYFWAALELYLTTNDEQYLHHINTQLPKIENGTYWTRPSALAYLSYLKTPASNPELDQKIKEKISQWGKQCNKIANSNPWRMAFVQQNLQWSSNGYLAENAIGLILQSFLRPSNTQAVANYLHYILGRNPVRVSFVTGIGHYQIKHPHHRLSVLHKRPLPGMLIGGINQYHQDGIARRNLKHLPPGRRYIDHPWSYSTNENSIDLAAYLIFVVSYLAWADQPVHSKNSLPKYHK